MTYRPYFRRLTMPKVQNIFSNYFCSKVISAAAGLIYHLRPHDHINDALATLHWLRVPERSANVQSSVRPARHDIWDLLSPSPTYLVGVLCGQ